MDFIWIIFVEFLGKINYIYNFFNEIKIFDKYIKIKLILFFFLIGLFVIVFFIERIGRKFTMGFEFFVFGVFVLLVNICILR